MTQERDNEVRTFLETYAKALGKGDLKKISGSWQAPALVLSDQGAIAVESAAQVEDFFTRARNSYREQGIVATKPEIAKLEWLSDAMVQVRTKWTNLGEDDKRKGSELIVYVLRRDEDHQLRIRVAITLAE